LLSFIEAVASKGDNSRKGLVPIGIRRGDCGEARDAAKVRSSGLTIKHISIKPSNQAAIFVCTDRRAYFRNKRMLCCVAGKGKMLLKHVKYMRSIYVSFTPMGLICRLKYSQLRSNVLRDCTH
jgi:hypothetical protein